MKISDPLMYNHYGQTTDYNRNAANIQAMGSDSNKVETGLSRKGFFGRDQSVSRPLPLSQKISKENSPIVAKE